MRQRDLVGRLILAHAVYGAALVAAPRLLTRAVPRGTSDRKTLAFARLLGTRHLLEAAILDHRRRRRWLLAGAAVDAAHSVTMASIAATVRSRRPLATANAIVALAFAVAGVRLARSSE